MTHTVDPAGINMKKLMALQMANIAIPKGGGLKDGIEFLLDKEKIKDAARQAKEFAEAAILAVRNAIEPNPFKNSTDDEIAGEILHKVELEKARRRNAPR